MVEISRELKCQCGSVSMTTAGNSIICAECLCTDCQNGGEFLQKREGAPNILDKNGATKFVLYRKDKIAFHGSLENIKSYYLTKSSKTQRVIASCCNTPMFLEFKGGHWLNIYALLWPEKAKPTSEVRTMTHSRREGVVLTNDIPNLKTHNVSFYTKLFSAWISMRFRSPKLDFVTGEIDD
ncbi:GFA family protein [Microbulbifer sp. CnH-101-G]|uniref:GFA family protein n=1 Tax=Microbulbifer sp. CnH-101-G TaxID=3243393 RepID=UPI004039571B